MLSSACPVTSNIGSSKRLTEKSLTTNPVDFLLILPAWCAGSTPRVWHVQFLMFDFTVLLS